MFLHPLPHSIHPHNHHYHSQWHHLHHHFSPIIKRLKLVFHSVYITSCMTSLLCLLSSSSLLLVSANSAWILSSTFPVWRFPTEPTGGLTFGTDYKYVHFKGIIQFFFLLWLNEDNKIFIVFPILWLHWSSIHRSKHSF